MPLIPSILRRKIRSLDRRKVKRRKLGQERRQAKPVLRITFEKGNRMMQYRLDAKPGLESAHDQTAIWHKDRRDYSSGDRRKVKSRRSGADKGKE